MILHEQHIEYKYGDVFKLKPIADWHLGHTYCDEKAIKAYLEDGKDDPYCYLVGVGDLLDSIIITDKRYQGDE